MRTDTADCHWNNQWANIAAGSKWFTPENDVKDWAAVLSLGAHVLDLCAGAGRHSLALAKASLKVTAFDAACEGLAAIKIASANVETVKGRMDELPFGESIFDHILSWNVIYHGDETVLLNTIGHMRRVLKPGGTALLTMLSKRRLAIDREKLNGALEISRNTWVFDDEMTDKRHPHYYCCAAEVLALFQGFEVLRMEDREHERPGSWHWHLIFERKS